MNAKLERRDAYRARREAARAAEVESTEAESVASADTPATHEHESTTWVVVGSSDPDRVGTQLASAEDAHEGEAVLTLEEYLSLGHDESEALEDPEGSEGDGSVEGETAEAASEEDDASQPVGLTKAEVATPDEAFDFSTENTYYPAPANESSDENAAG